MPAPRPKPRVVTMRKPTNHGVHLLLSFMTLGLWLPVWACVWASEWRQIAPRFWYGDLPREGR